LTLQIELERVGNRYSVVVTEPEWRSERPLTAREVLRELSGLGIHSTDITDALSEADPGWGDHMDG
jgi:hypothetical protein